LINKNKDAQGFLLYVVPIVLRINIFIVNIDTTDKARRGENPCYNIQEAQCRYKDISLYGNDSLNNNDKDLYVIRIDGHYDLIHKIKKEENIIYNIE
jgi:hypothetical protein